MTHKPLNPGGGKGSADRVANRDSFNENFERIFGTKKPEADKNKQPEKDKYD